MKSKQEKRYLDLVRQYDRAQNALMVLEHKIDKAYMTLCRFNDRESTKIGRALNKAAKKSV